MRTKQCPQCGQPPQLFVDVDTFGCIKCNIWTEQPHACNQMYGECDAGFDDAPAYPSNYTGDVKNPPRYQ